MKIMSLDIQLEDLKAVSELFSIRAPHKSEIEELLNYQEKNKLEFYEQRACERFVLEIYYNLQPSDDRILTSKIEYVDARLKTWRYAMEFKSNLHYILNVFDTFNEIADVIESDAIADILKLSLFQGNLINSSRESQKEIKAFQMTSLLKLMKYKNNNDIHFFDVILQQLYCHIEYIKCVQVNKFCMLFDDNNNGMKSFISMIKDFTQEQEANMQMMLILTSYDNYYKEYMEHILTAELTIQAEKVKGQPQEVELKVIKLYSWVGILSNSSECKKMDSIFKNFYYLLTHLQSRLVYLDEQGLISTNGIYFDVMDSTDVSKSATQEKEGKIQTKVTRRKDLDDSLLYL